MTYTLGFSPCPNDTFIFDALVNGHIDTRGLEVSYVLEDVETLNRYALEGKLDITKLSYSTLLHTIHQYALLHSGSALGKGVGPLLVAKQGFDLGSLPEKTIAIPGANTTANLLLTLAHPKATNKTEVLFSNIEQAVLDGAFDAGLIIHESRFTYAAKGLVQLMDLGDWWERTTQAPIPLGGIVARRSLPRAVIATVDALIKESIAWSWQRYPQLSPFVTQHAQEMEPAVMRQHIDLYVNDYTNDLGTTGRHAIDTLFATAKAAGLIAGRFPETIYY
jgi:1,4-dihydroxy-6-naphthoate synthase